jgi:DNA-binding response OmpR family regulator
MTKEKPRILIVDDEASVCQILKAGLEMHGFTVRFEVRSTDTIKACLEFHPDLVLLDVDMPVKDGGEVASELQSHPTLRRTPVIFLTSLVSKEEAAKRSASGEMFLSKQIPIAELVARIRAVLQPQTPH